MNENGDETTQKLHFFYDAQSKPAFIEYEGTMYRCVHNLQGDIVAIVDAAGNLVVEYKYDAWGKPTAITGTLKTTLGALNPFRYRGYVWDEDAELYYLQNRYYNSGVSRFINADAYLGMKGILNHDLFGYCKNNPIMYIDPTGLTKKPWEIMGINYDGTASDFRRLENGLPPLAYENLMKNGGSILVNKTVSRGAGITHKTTKVTYYTYDTVCDLLEDIDVNLEDEDYKGAILFAAGLLGKDTLGLIGVLLSLIGFNEGVDNSLNKAAARRLRTCKDNRTGLLVIESKVTDPDGVVLGFQSYYSWNGDGNLYGSEIYGYDILDKPIF